MARAFGGGGSSFGKLRTRHGPRVQNKPSIDSFMDDTRLAAQPSTCRTIPLSTNALYGSNTGRSPKKSKHLACIAVEPSSIDTPASCILYPKAWQGKMVPNQGNGWSDKDRMENTSTVFVLSLPSSPPSNALLGGVCPPGLFVLFVL